MLSLGLGRIGSIYLCDSADTGSGIVEAGCCDTSQHRWQSLNEDSVGRL